MFTSPIAKADLTVTQNSVNATTCCQPYTVTITPTMSPVISNVSYQFSSAMLNSTSCQSANLSANVMSQLYYTNPGTGAVGVWADVNLPFVFNLTSANSAGESFFQYGEMGQCNFTFPSPSPTPSGSFGSKVSIGLATFFLAWLYMN